jgi:hypothetical protein
MDCIEAITLNDGRELFYVNFDFKLSMYIDDYCVGPEDGKLEKDT